MRFNLAAAESGWLRHPFKLPRKYKGWLADHGSLTARLKAICAGFSVQIVRSGRLCPNHDETLPLHLQRREQAYVREVVLRCGHEKGYSEVVFAHSVVPAASLRGAWAPVTRLGTRPLGEALFSNPRVKRGELQYRRISLRHPLMRQVLRAGLVPQSKSLWARRSVFYLRGHPLMVTEVFLPAVLEVTNEA